MFFNTASVDRFAAGEPRMQRGHPMPKMRMNALVGGAFSAAEFARPMHNPLAVGSVTTQAMLVTSVDHIGDIGSKPGGIHRRTR